MERHRRETDFAIPLGFALARPEFAPFIEHGNISIGEAGDIGVACEIGAVVYTHLSLGIWNFTTKWHTICARFFVQRMTATMDQEACDV